MQQLTTTGHLVRIYRDGLQSGGWLPAVVARAAPETAQLLRQPPRPAEWGAGSWLLNVARALHEVGGRKACRRVGAHVAKQTVEGPLRLIAKPLLALYRSNPEGAYGRLGSVVELLLRGPDFVYLARNARSGVLELTHLERAPEGLYALWEGTLLQMHRGLGVEGGVGVTRVSPSGRSGVIHVSWEPPGPERDEWLA